MGNTIDKNYIHIQAESSKIWTVTHRLSKYPAVTIVDGEGKELFGLIQHLDDSVVKIEFSSMMTGRVYCN